MNRDVNDDLTFVRGVLSAADPAGPGTAASPVFAAPDVIGDLWDTPAVSAGRPSRRRAIVIAAVGCAAVVVAAALASSGGSGRPTAGRIAASGPSKAVFAAYAMTQQARSAKATFSASAGEFRMTGSGVGDLVTGDGQVTVNLPAPMGQLQAVGVAGSYYLQLPAQLMALNGGKAWAKVDRTLVEQLIGQQIGSPSLAATFDPSRALELLKSVSGPVTVVGSETLPEDATPSTHYRATVDLAKVAAAAPSVSAPADLWLDAEGRLRKLTLSIDLSTVHLPDGAPRGPSRATGVATLELTDYGKPVTVTAPPADQVGDLGPLASLIAGGR